MSTEYAAEYTAEPPPWLEVVVCTGTYATRLCCDVVRWCAEWHVRNRRELPPELADSVRAVEPRGYMHGWPSPIGGGMCGRREDAERMAEHIRRAEPVVLRMITACSTGDGGAQVPDKLERVSWTLKRCKDAADDVARAGAAHDAAVAQFFNPGADA